MLRFGRSLWRPLRQARMALRIRITGRMVERGLKLDTSAVVEPCDSAVVLLKEEGISAVLQRREWCLLLGPPMVKARFGSVRLA